MSDELYEANEKWWSERARYHLDTDMYREFVDRLRTGKDALLPFDDRVLGSLTGLHVLHLQCHVGTDTLSLARRGATVTGLDFSSDAVQTARRLSEELGIPATFVQGNAVALPDDLGTFDLVYTSYGALCWLQDLTAWANGIAARLRPGGRLVVIDGHPVWGALDDDPVQGDKLLLGYTYMEGVPHRWDNPGSYAKRDAATKHNHVWEWFHSLGEIVNAVIGAGLVVEELTEHPEAFCALFDGMVRGEDRLWRLPEPVHGRFPLTFTLAARQPSPRS